MLKSLLILCAVLCRDLRCSQARRQRARESQPISGPAASARADRAAAIRDYLQSWQA